MPHVQTTQAPVRDAFDARGFGPSNMDDPALAAAFAAADREAGQAFENLSPPESRGVVWEDSLGFPDGDLNEMEDDDGVADSDIEDYCAEIVFWLTDFSDAEEGLSNWTVFSEHHAA